MPLVWVSGVSGAGKSALARALRAAGEVAYDLDDDGRCAWRRRADGTAVDDPPERPDGWLDEHGWFADVARLRALDEDRPVYLCGGAENGDEVVAVASAVVCLLVDDATLGRRLAGRSHPAFGGSDEERAAVLAWNRTARQRFAAVGAAFVDASRPLDEVVAAVRAAAQAALRTGQT